MKREGGRKRSCDTNCNKTHDYQMLNEIKEIDNKIDKQIKDNNKKYESFQYRKEELNKVIEKNKIGKISLIKFLDMEANEKVKMLIRNNDNDNYSLFEVNEFQDITNNKSSINNSNFRKIILKSNDTNKNPNEELNKNKKRTEENPLTLSQNMPRKKANSNLNNHLSIVSNRRESVKTSRQFNSGNKQPDLNRE
jgi:hypothetical protein